MEILQEERKKAWGDLGRREEVGEEIASPGNGKREANGTGRPRKHFQCFV